ncbi:TRAP transporter small permease [Ochrobactrum sp. EDr1-4]|uniref:TRAP transporter small permease n=1 Tax=Ochrobactrum sp. EDr1-4 TaxID=3368622 RepID=UPI003BA09A06
MEMFFNSRLGRCFNKAEIIIAVIAFMLMLSVVVLNVGMRYFGATSLLSTEELAYLGFTWSTFMAVAYIYRTKGMIAIDFFLELVPRSVQRFVIIAVDMLLIAANIWLVWLAWQLASGGWVRKTAVLEVPYFWVNLAPLSAFVLMTIYSVIHLLHSLRGEPDHVPLHETVL